MSSGLMSRLNKHKKYDLVRSHSQAQLLTAKLRQDGVMVAVEGVIQAVDQVAHLLASNPSNVNYTDSIINLCQHLKVYGAYLEILYKDKLDHAFRIFRDKSLDDMIDMMSKVHLLELIELRAKGWKGTDGMNTYYKKKMNQCSSQDQMSETASILSLSESMSSVLTLNTAPPILAPGEVLKASGKFMKPTRIPGKKYCKDEVVIRNADSGKVMGIKGRRVHMIEEISETIISFQRVNPGAKERLVQITGANEESINYAKKLIEDTIRRNASPVREGSAMVGGPLTGSSSSINSSNSEDSAMPTARISRLMHSLSTPDANLGEYKYTVTVHGHVIKISGTDPDLVRTSKLVLDEYFSGEPLQDVSHFYSFDSLAQPNGPDDIDNPLSPPISPATPDAPVLNGPTLTKSGSSVALTSKKCVENEEKPTMRHRQFSVEEMRKSRLSVDKDESLQTFKNRLTYSIDILVRLGMSPSCLSEPDGWSRIVEEYPMVVRKVAQRLDSEKYLSTRLEESSVRAISDEDDEED